VRPGPVTRRGEREALNRVSQVSSWKNHWKRSTHLVCCAVASAWTRAGVVDYILPTTMVMRGLLTPSQLMGVSKILGMGEMRRGGPGGRSECWKALDELPQPLPQGKSRRSNKEGLWSRGEEMFGKCPGEARWVLSASPGFGTSQISDLRIQLLARKERTQPLLLKACLK